MVVKPGVGSLKKAKEEEVAYVSCQLRVFPILVAKQPGGVIMSQKSKENKGDKPKNQKKDNKKPAVTPSGLTEDQLLMLNNN